MNMDEEVFACLEGDIFAQQEMIDSEKIMKVIRNMDEYKSLSKIISEETEKGFPQKKITFKLKTLSEIAKDNQQDASFNSQESQAGTIKRNEMQSNFLTVKVKKLN